MVIKLQKITFFCDTWYLFKSKALRNCQEVNACLSQVWTYTNNNPMQNVLYKEKNFKAKNNEMTSKCRKELERTIRHFCLPFDFNFYALCLELQGVKSIILINTPQLQMWVKFTHSHRHTFTSPMLQRQNSVKVEVSSEHRHIWKYLANRVETILWTGWVTMEEMEELQLHHPVAPVVEEEDLIRELKYYFQSRKRL